MGSNPGCRSALPSVSPPLPLVAGIERRAETTPRRKVAIGTPGQIFLLLVAYSLSLVVATGFMGFHGDTWQIIDLSYRKSLGESLRSITGDFRPLEAIFWILEFKLIGLNSFLAHATSLFLHAAQVLLFGIALQRWQRCPRVFLAAAMLFAFFFPAVSNLTYLVHTDNARLAGAFFWLSVVVLQSAQRRSAASPWLAAGGGGALALLSLFTYENYSFLILAIPLLVVPAGGACADDHGRWPRRTWWWYCLGLLVVYLAVRASLLDGGAVAAKGVQVGTLPMLAGSALASVSLYLSTPVVDVVKSSARLLSALPLVASLGLLGAAALRWGRAGVPSRPASSVFKLGCLVMALGLAPYAYAGYVAQFGYLSHGRVLSSFAFGLAVIFAGAVQLVVAQRKLWGHGIALALFLLVGFYASNHFQRSADWRGAAAMQKRFFSSLLEVAPDVVPGTTFLLKNSQIYSDQQRAAVITGNWGLLHLLKIIYDEPTLGAYQVFARDPNYREAQPIAVSPAGVRSAWAKQLIPLDAVIILRQRQLQLELVEAVSLSDQDWLMTWTGGMTSLASNRQRIRPARAATPFTEYYLQRLPEGI